jgi:hypothetical protein
VKRGRNSAVKTRSFLDTEPVFYHEALEGTEEKNFYIYNFIIFMLFMVKK